MTATDWRKAVGMGRTSFYRRLALEGSPQRLVNWFEGKSLTVVWPTGRRELLRLVGGRVTTVEEWCDLFDVSYPDYEARIRAGMTALEALTFRKEWAREPLYVDPHPCVSPSPECTPAPRPATCSPFGAPV